MCYCPTPTLHLNLALTGDGAFIFSLKKTHSVWFISVFKLCGHWKCPHKSPSPCNTYVIPMPLYKFVSHKPHKHTHTTHTHTLLELTSLKTCNMSTVIISCSCLQQSPQEVIRRGMNSSRIHYEKCIMKVSKFEYECVSLLQIQC